MTIFLGIIVIILSTLLIWKSAYVGQYVPIRWAEEHMNGAGQAGSVTFYRLVGVLLILGSFLAMTGLLQRIILGVFGGGRA